MDITMLDVLKERLPEGLEIKATKEKSSKYEVTFVFDGVEEKAELPKTCAPAYQNETADSTVRTAMSAIYIKKGDYAEAQAWLHEERQTKKMGRPKATKPKDIELGVRFDAETAEMLEDYCQRHKITKGEAVRRGIKKLVEADGA